MKDRLQKFMESEHLTSSRLAEIMGVQPSNISHILGGRNKPSFEFIEKMLQRFPKINPDWLLLGKGPLYRTDIRPVAQPEVRDDSSPAVSLFSEITATGPDEEKPRAAPAHPQPYIENDERPIDPYPVEEKKMKKECNVELPQTRPADEIDYIIVFYKDKSFIRYRPKF